MLNLAINGRDAMHCGGRLTIETENAISKPLCGPQIGVPAGQYVLIAVTDTGVGHDSCSHREGLRSILHHERGRQGHRSGHSAKSTASRSSLAAT